MKKIIISSIAALTLITGALIVIPMNNGQENANLTPPEPVQHVIEPETVIHAPEQVEAVVEPLNTPVENKVVNTTETQVKSLQEKWISWIKSNPTQKDCYDNLVREFPDLFKSERFDETITGLSHFPRMCDPRIRVILEQNGNRLLKHFNLQIVSTIEKY